MEKTPTIPLDAVGQEFWARHFDRLLGRKILTEGDMDSFSVLCAAWSKVYALSGVEPGAENFREMVQYVAILKQYQSLAKQFGLLPRDRRTDKLEGEDPEATKDEFGI